MAKRNASCSVQLARARRELKAANVLLDECSVFVRDVLARDTKVKKALAAIKTKLNSMK
jgi:hypothetical protein